MELKFLQNPQTFNRFETIEKFFQKPLSNFKAERYKKNILPKNLTKIAKKVILLMFFGSIFGRFFCVFSNAFRVFFSGDMFQNQGHFFSREQCIQVSKDKEVSQYIAQLDVQTGANNHQLMCSFCVSRRRMDFSLPTSFPTTDSEKECRH